jgi:hypothetical protein
MFAIGIKGDVRSKETSGRKKVVPVVDESGRPASTDAVHDNRSVVTDSEQWDLCWALASSSRAGGG